MRLLLILALCLSACRHRPVQVDVPLSKPITQEAFTAVQVKPNSWLVWIRQSAHRTEALKAVGCGTCTVTSIGYVVAVERRN